MVILLHSKTIKYALRLRAGQRLFCTRQSQPFRDAERALRRGECDVLPVALFQQSDSTSKLHIDCDQSAFKYSQLCKAFKRNDCNVDKSGTVRCVSCCQGGNTWLNRWHRLEDNHKIKYGIGFDAITNMDTHMKSSTRTKTQERSIKMRSHYNVPPPSGTTVDNIQGQISDTHGSGGGGGGLAGGNHGIKRRRLLQAGTSS